MNDASSSRWSRKDSAANSRDRLCRRHLAGGEWFVTSSGRHQPFGTGYQLYIMRPDGTEQQRLTKSGLNVYARFSPDNSQILYVFQNRDGNKLKIISIDGTGERTFAAESGVSNSLNHATEVLTISRTVQLTGNHSQSSNWCGVM